MAMQTPEKIIHEALSKREQLLDQNTNALRLLDGYGDGAPDLYLDSLNDRWLVSTTDSKLPEEWKKALSSFGKTLYWKALDQHQKESPIHLSGPEEPEPFLVRENGLAYEVSFHSGYSQGIFLDQRENRQLVSQLAQTDHRILNTFAYTGPFSIAAATGGATTTTLDLSQPYLEWAKRNFTHNQMDPVDHYFCKGDTFHWLKRFAKQGRHFNGIILDPPTFSRDDKGKVFSVPKDYHRLIALAKDCLTNDGWILACTNDRRLTPLDFEDLIRKGLPSDTQQDLKHLPMPIFGK